MIFGHYVNKKTGGTYRAIAFAINKTNENDGQAMVVYHPEDNENTILVREEGEFSEKFEDMGSWLKRNRVRK